MTWQTACEEADSGKQRLNRTEQFSNISVNTATGECFGLIITPQGSLQSFNTTTAAWYKDKQHMSRLEAASHQTALTHWFTIRLYHDTSGRENWQNRLWIRI